MMDKVILGDCFKTIKTIPNESIDLIVTSPPYADIKKYGKEINILHPDNYID
jgi:site-specific DNA-methyltransferase (adenine-specific)